ncbi:hypothetical protein EDEG_03635 [Edhazardia aedis USNM 41457]|uniref:Uncharacterized protein n=1 Tax=Edhazardia aedis (strain USNM 41457) TaxID=1003232 RepID=J9DKH7_EDHAE|nr:hypothetical protein EDEG_03635 [Edhazardia aedis USNM 41457]|eukprot:EJW01892.1 hypothetical protein EDEG_03635 [Edhazardia aedis USNM 41457]
MLKQFFVSYLIFVLTTKNSTLHDQFTFEEDATTLNDYNNAFENEYNKINTTLKEIITFFEKSNNKVYESTCNSLLDCKLENMKSSIEELLKFINDLNIIISEAEKSKTHVEKLVKKIKKMPKKSDYAKISPISYPNDRIPYLSNKKDKSNIQIIERLLNEENKVFIAFADEWLKKSIELHKFANKIIKTATKAKINAEKQYKDFSKIEFYEYIPGLEYGSRSIVFLMLVGFFLVYYITFYDCSLYIG